MSRRGSIIALVAAVLLTAAVTFCISYLVLWNSFSTKVSQVREMEARYAKFNEIERYLSEHYILNGELDEEKLMEGAADGMIQSLPTAGPIIWTRKPTLPGRTAARTISSGLA